MGGKVKVNFMGNELDRWRETDNTLDAERRRMNAALTEVREARAGVRGKARLIFALDLTASRKASLKKARLATAAMFDTVKAVGEVSVKLVYYRGWQECRATGWHNDPGVLSGCMQRLSCKTGGTQIARVLRFVLAEKEAVSGVVLIVDECEDDAEELAGLAAMLGDKRIPLFVFHECAVGDSSAHPAKPVFERLAAASHGVYSEFDPESALALRELLASVAAFSVAGGNGVEQVEHVTTPEARHLQSRLLMLGAGGKTARGVDVLRGKA